MNELSKSEHQLVTVLHSASGCDDQDDRMTFKDLRRILANNPASKVSTTTSEDEADVNGSMSNSKEHIYEEIPAAKAKAKRPLPPIPVQQEATPPSEHKQSIKKLSTSSIATTKSKWV